MSLRLYSAAVNILYSKRLSPVSIFFPAIIMEAVSWCNSI